MHARVASPREASDGAEPSLRAKGHHTLPLEIIRDPAKYVNFQVACTCVGARMTARSRSEASDERIAGPPRPHPRCGPPSASTGTACRKRRKETKDATSLITPRSSRIALTAPPFVKRQAMESDQRIVGLLACSPPSSSPVVSDDPHFPTEGLHSTSMVEANAGRRARWRSGRTPQGVGGWGDHKRRDHELGCNRFWGAVGKCRPEAKIGENPLDDLWLLIECYGPHGPTKLGAEQGIGLIDLLDEPCALLLEYPRERERFHLRRSGVLLVGGT